MRNQSGFTFIELLISVTIFVTITVAMVANFKAGDDVQELRQSAELYATHVRSAQTKAIAGINATSTTSYGVMVNAAGATQFRPYVDPTSSGNNAYNNGEQTQTILLLPDVTFETVGGLDVNFDVPNGTVYFGGVAATLSATTTLQHSSSNQRIDVLITPFSGQVTISNPY